MKTGEEKEIDDRQDRSAVCSLFFLLLLFALSLSRSPPYGEKIDGALSTMWMVSLSLPHRQGKAKFFLSFYTQTPAHTHSSRATNLLLLRSTEKKIIKWPVGHSPSFCRCHSNCTSREVFSRESECFDFFFSPFSSSLMPSTYIHPSGQFADQRRLIMCW